MREILFRAKAVNRPPKGTYRTDYENGDWVYGLISDINEYSALMTNTDGVGGIDIDKGTVCEYTGVTERSGVDCIKVKGLKIFEDDIVRVLYTDWGSKDENDSRTLKEYLRDIAGVGVVKRTEYGEWRILINDYLYPMDCGKYGYIEVIGNIHDNPELLEVD